MTRKILAMICDINEKHVEAFKLDDFSWLSRSNIKELFRFCAKNIYDRIADTFFYKICLDDETKKLLQPYDLDNITCYVYKFGNKKCCIITREVYSSKQLFETIQTLINADILNNTLLNNCIEQVEQQLENSEISSTKNLSHIINNVEEIKDILHISLDALLKRGEKLDDLIDKSSELSMTTKTFKKNSDKLRKCCQYL